MGKKEEIKLALFMDNMIIEYTKEPTKKHLELASAS